MTIAIADDHLLLSQTVADVLEQRQALAAARSALEAEGDVEAPFTKEAVELGWTGLHVPEADGGSGFGLLELVVVVEQLGARVAPGAFTTTAIATALLSSPDAGGAHTDLLRSLVAGERHAAVALDADVEVRDGRLHGVAQVVVAAGLADVALLPVGDDVAVVSLEGGAAVEPRANLDPTRRSARVTFDGAEATVILGARQRYLDLARTILAAEAVGVARACTEMAAQYAKERQQFGRPIGMFQAVKHHCADMLVATELATAAVWDAARAPEAGGEVLSYTAAAAAVLAGRAADDCANLNIQVHGGIAITWEHDAHLYLRRATVLRSLLRPPLAAVDLVGLVRAGVRREASIELPPEAEQLRAEVQTFIADIRDLDQAAQRTAMVDAGYVMPHWPAPWGRDAGPVEQLVIEQEMAAAEIARPNYGITGWNILTIIQHGTEDQVARWVPPALREEVTWCQLFSEPDAGSDAAAVRTRATRVDGGWLLNGQKVWTSGAHVAAMGFATVRTDPDAAKHDGITMMAVDMHAKGVEVRPLRQINGGAEFNEVFFDDVVVPDDDVVGPVNGGWAVARATLGNESVSLGGGQGIRSVPGELLVQYLDGSPAGVEGGEARVGRYVAGLHAMGLLNLRSAHRAVAGGGPGPEGAVTKLVTSELGHEAAAMFAELGGDETLFMDGSAAIGNGLVLMHRALSIAGGTSEIKRNQIGERILGLPRDPLVK